MEIKGFTFFRSYRDAAKALPDSERVKFYDALIDYGLDEKEPSDKDDILLNALFSIIKPIIDKSTAHARAGMKGGRPSATKSSIVEKHSELKEWARLMDEETKNNQMKPNHNQN